ncbi:MAG: hypothetical protein ACLFUS_02575 [Candidatus Sumerlaeia bacterium]
MAGKGIPFFYRPSDSFFKRSLVASAFVGGLLAMFFAVKVGMGFGLRYAVWLAWMILNLTIWSAGLHEYLGKRRIGLILAFIVAKGAFVGLLVVLVILLKINTPSYLVAFLAGLNTPFLVILLKAMGRYLINKNTFPLKNAEEDAETKKEDARKDVA